MLLRKINITYGLRYTSSNGVLLSGYTDSDWAGSAVDRKSTSGYCFSMGSAMISWFSRKQGSIAQITVEAEYIVVSYSDWAGSAVNQKSTSGYCFSMGSSMISWSSKKQGSIAQSKVEAEYIVAIDA